MGKRIQKILREERQKQSIEELERKWNKAKGRYCNRYWCEEWLDLAEKRTEELVKFFRGG